MKLRLLSYLAGLGLLGSCLVPSSADGILASVKSTGMAATAISYPLDSMCIAYNPAGIVWVCDRVDLEAGWLRNTAHINVHGNVIPPANGRFTAMRTKDTYFAGGGFVKGGCFECVEWAVGAAIYNRNFQKTTYKHPYVLFGTSNPGLEYVNETVAPAVAVKFWDCHSLGVAFNIQIVRLKVNGLQNFDNPNATIAPGHVTNRGYSYSHGFTPTIGYRFATDRFGFGITWQPRTHMSKLHKYKGFVAGGRLDVPEKWGFGVSYDVIPCITVAFDAELVKWSGCRGFNNKLRLPRLVFTPPPPHIVDKLGSKSGAGFGFRDQWYYRVGAEWRLSDAWSFRAGYRYARALPRKSQTAVNALDCDCVQSFLTLGATYTYNCQIELSGLFAYGFKHKVHGKNSIPVGLPPGGLGGGEADLTEQKYALGIALGYQF